MLHCSNCERPLCVDCGVTAAVGIKCKDCGRISRAAQARVPLAKVAQGAAAGIVLGLLAGFLFQEFRNTFSFFSLFLAWGIGIGVAEGVRRAAGGFRDTSIAMVASLCSFVGVLWPAIFIEIQQGGRIRLDQLLFPVVAACVAAFFAYKRDL